ncbi:DUF4302 domain-containing protein [Capnocytophaga sp. oral taxon 878]|uniref:DUF4302 domain-containing protein n=1 Tax=Capnocytophaga sp. oral taxon 878 TaxID=1316596 RepID=UPI000D03EF66|nr:DUF4302 domain-containing protein [Capnocytophaga sp. oral taxon 878]AVM49626.1 hypothetical protein C4H12_03615 [Capnocytophaga sp. oral taxon 878]
MKKYIFLSLSFLLFISCNYKEEETFTQRASERTVNSLNSYKEILENDNYWLLTYYPEQYKVGYWVYPYQPEIFATDKDFPKAHRSIGGYNFLIKLKDGKVAASSEVSYTNTEETSFFSYDITEGPTLSFDTFNNVLHHFRFVSSSFPNARGGETDFIILKYENDTFTLRGRTSNNIMTLKKFTGNRETFLNKIRENSKALLYKGLLPINVGGTEVILKLFPSYRQLTFIYNNNQKYIQSAFIITEKGIKLYEPIKINGVTFEEFYFNDTKTALVSADGSITSNFVTSPITLSSNAAYITFDTYNASEKAMNIFNKAKKAVENSKDKSYTLLNYIRLVTFMGNDQEQAAGIHGYIAEKNNLDNTSSIYYEMDFVGMANSSNEKQLEILIKDMPTIGDNTYKNSLFYYREAERLFLDLAKAGPYKTSVYNDNYTYLISVKDPDIWFLVYIP